MHVSGAGVAGQREGGRGHESVHASPGSEGRLQQKVCLLLAKGFVFQPLSLLLERPRSLSVTEVKIFSADPRPAARGPQQVPL